MRESVKQGNSQWNLKEDSHRRSGTRQVNTWHERTDGASDISRSASKWPAWESKDSFKRNDPSCLKTDADQHMDNGANKETGGWEAACSHGGRKSSPSGDETGQEKQNHSHKNCWEQPSRPVRTSDAGDIVKNDSNWPAWDSSTAIKRTDPVDGKSDPVMDNGASKETRGWEAAQSYGIRRSSPSADETRQQNHNHFQKKGWDQLRRGRSRSRSAGRDLKWEGKEQGKISRNGSGKSSPSRKKSTAGSWDRGDQSRGRSRSTERTLKWEGYEQGEKSRNGSGKSSPSQKKSSAGPWDRGDQARGRSRSDNKNQNWNRSSTQSQILSSDVKFKSNSYDRRDQNLSESGDSLGLCKDFQAGKCRRGHDCRFLHPDGHRYRDEKSEGRESRYERAFRHDDERGGNASRVKTSCNEGRGEPRKNITTSSDPCKDFLVGKCHRGSSCKYMHDSSDKFDTSNRNQIVDHKIDHGSPPNRKFKSRSHDDKLVSVSNDGQNMWNGPTWEDTNSVSNGLKGTRQDNHDAGKSNIIAERAADRCRSSHRRNDNLGHDNKPTPYGSGDMFCKYLTTGKCRDDGHCRYSHGDPAERRPQSQSQDSRGAHVSDDVKKLWPAWGSSTRASKTANFTGWDNNDDKNMDFSSPVLIDKDPKRDESTAYGSGDTLCKYLTTGTCRDGGRCRYSHGDPAERRPQSQSQDNKRAHVSNDVKKLWPAWGSSTGASKTTNFTGWGNNDDKNMDFSDACGPVLKDKDPERDEPTAYGSGDALCKYLTTGKCRDGGRCRYSHGDPAERRPQSQYQDSRRAHVSDDVKKLWPAWGSSTGASKTANIIGWGSNDDKDMDISDACSPILKDKDPERDEHRYPELVTGSYGAITAFLESTEKKAVKLELQSILGSAQSHKLNGTDDSKISWKPESHVRDEICNYSATKKCPNDDHHMSSHDGLAYQKSKSQSSDSRRSHATGDGKNLWNGPSWDDKIAVSKAAKFTGCGNNSDVRNINMTGTVAIDSTSNWLGHGLDNGYDVRDSLTLKDKAASRDQQLSSDWGSEKGSAKKEPSFIAAPPKLQMVNATNDVKTKWKGPTCRNEYLRSDKIAPCVDNHMFESQESGKVCKNSAIKHSVDSDLCRFSHDYPGHKKAKSQSLGVKQTHATGDGKNSWTGPAWEDSIVVSETAKLNGWATDMKVDDRVATKSISSRLDHAIADNNAKCVILILNDKAAQTDNHVPPPELATGSDGAVLGDPEKKVDAKNYVKEEAQIRSMGTQSQRSNKDNNACLTCFSSQNEADSSKKIVISEHVSSHGELEPIVSENNQILPETQTQGRGGSYLKKVDVENWIDGGNRNTYVMFRNALVELVKEFLTPAWKDGRISKEIYKLISKKVVDKVCGSMQIINIPRTREQVNHYLASNQSSISQLTHDYVSIYQDTRPMLAH